MKHLMNSQILFLQLFRIKNQGLLNANLRYPLPQPSQAYEPKQKSELDSSSMNSAEDTFPKMDSTNAMGLTFTTQKVSVAKIMFSKLNTTKIDPDSRDSRAESRIELANAK